VLFHHLAARPPWRLSGAPHKLPRRPDLVSLVLDDLPRSNPFRLDAGRRAMALAHAATSRALDQRIEADVVRITADARGSA
jgi:hypothetical protein